MLIRRRARKDATHEDRAGQDSDQDRSGGFWSFLATVVDDNQTTARLICVLLTVAAGTSLIIGSIAVPLIVIAFQVSTIAGVSAVCGSVATVVTAVATAVASVVRYARRLD